WLFVPDYPWWKFINRPVAGYNEMEELHRRARTADAVAFSLHARRTVKYRSSSVENVVLAGVSHEYYKIRPFDLAGGRYFTQAEMDAGARQVILGHKVAEGLFGDGTDPVGKSVK